MKQAAFYDQAIIKTQARVATSTNRLRILSVLRLATVLISGFALYFFWTIAFSWLIALAGMAIFLFFVRRHADCAKQLGFEKALLHLFKDEIVRFEGGWRKRSSGKEFHESGHPFSADLNFFGDKGIFAYLNRGPSPWAQLILADWLKYPEMEKEEILSKQAAVAELATKPDFLFNYIAEISLAPAALNLRAKLHRWTELKLNQPAAWKDVGLAYLMPAVSIISLVAWSLDFLTFSQWILLLIIPAVPIAIRFQKHQAAFNAMQAAGELSQRFGGLLERIQAEKFQKVFFDYGEKKNALFDAIAQFKALGSIQGAVDSRNNLVVSLGLNILLQWDYHCFRRLAKWKASFGEGFYQWVEFCQELEAQISFGIYAFNNPDYSYASFELTEGVRMVNGRHILMDQLAVGNSIDLADSTRMAIITGANMAGKSTFLRMVSTHMVLSQCGLPVQAEKMEMAPVAIFTSMLTTDSLADQESYFFNEIKRLRQLVDLAQSGQPIFAVLDEILKGTNSIDKMKGSAAFVRKLMTLPIRGLIATHDLSLCQLVSEYPEDLANYRFEIDFTDGDLSFRYKLEPGVCANMNATYLLEKYGLIDPPSAAAIGD